MKKTEWFTPGTTPVHVGVYETRASEKFRTHFQHWDGWKWGFYMPTVRTAEVFKDDESCDQRPEWRGLTEPQS